MKEVHVKLTFVVRQIDGEDAMSDALNIVDSIKNEGVDITDLKMTEVVRFEINNEDR